MRCNHCGQTGHTLNPCEGPHLKGTSRAGTTRAAARWAACAKEKGARSQARVGVRTDLGEEDVWEEALEELEMQLFGVTEDREKVNHASTTAPP